MSASLKIAQGEKEFAQMKESAGRCCHLAVRLPDWPFIAGSGYVCIFEFDRVMGSDFGGVLGALAAEFGDTDIVVVGLSPTEADYLATFEAYPGFAVDTNSVQEGYGVGLRHRPGGDPTGALVDTVDVLAIVGSTNRWSLWGQRDWEIALLHTPVTSGPWLEQGIPTFEGQFDLAEIRSPTGWGLELTDGALAAFWANVRSRGSGQ